MEWEFWALAAIYALTVTALIVAHTLEVRHLRRINADLSEAYRDKCELLQKEREAQEARPAPSRHVRRVTARRAPHDFRIN